MDQRQSAYKTLKVLENVYLTLRQIGASEATYRLLKKMYLNSNITTLFLTTGFPEIRYRLLHWTEE